MISQKTIENVKSKINIVDVIGNYIQLKKSGSNYKGLCPFHSERSPSFVVSPQKNIYHCFGCGASGDAIKFVMEYEHLSYPEAIEKLALMYNIPIEKTNIKIAFNTKLLNEINDYYIKNLQKNKNALDYLLKRGLSEESIEEFQLGFAPSIEEQMQYFSKFDKNELIKYGVLTKTSSPYPRLINRITFPIFSLNSNIIAFGGRTISNHPAKYINFENTPLFDKSKTLYGLYQAKNHIFKKKNIFITEGYFDVIMMHQAGYNTAVASLGTAFTKEHLTILLNRFIQNDTTIYLLYDSDEAGINSALKASKMFIQKAINGRVILLPNKKDPADIIKEENSIEKYIKSSKTFIKFIISKTIEKYDIKEPIQKALCAKELKEFILSIEDELVRYSFKEEVEKILLIPIQLKQNNIYTNQTNKKKHLDVGRAAILKTIYSQLKNNNYNLLNEIIEFLTPEDFNELKEAATALFKEDLENPSLLEIVLLDNIKEIENEKEFYQIISSILLRKFEQQLKTTPLTKDNLYTIRKLKEEINLLKQNRWEEFLEKYLKG